jgi:hypothetical protein
MRSLLCRSSCGATVSSLVVSWCDAVFRHYLDQRVSVLINYLVTVIFEKIYSSILVFVAYDRLNKLLLIVPHE